MHKGRPAAYGHQRYKGNHNDAADLGLCQDETRRNTRNADDFTEDLTTTAMIQPCDAGSFTAELAATSEEPPPGNAECRIMQTHLVS